MSTAKPKRALAFPIVAVLALALAVAASATRTRWLPTVTQFFNSGASADAEEPEAHATLGSETSIQLSASGLKNIGYQPHSIELTGFERKLTLPAMVVERPGQTQIHLAAPLTGIVTGIRAGEGEAVEPGAILFTLRLTHEELVAAQREFLRTAESLDVVAREITRLGSLGEGVIAGRRILEQEYERQKLEASLKAERQALLLHGLTSEQVEAILTERELFQKLEVRAPDHLHDHDGCKEEHSMHVQQLEVTLGEQVDVGNGLCVLADHCELYVEGRAFEDDADDLRQAARNDWDISARLLVGDRSTKRVTGLKLRYLADRIDPNSRAFRVYLRLPNRVALDQTAPDGRRFLEWQFKPGQRMELQIPVEQWEKEIVLPVTAVTDEGSERYVYRQNGDHFDRIPVHVKHRDSESVVVANDGALFPGDIVAGRGAYQLHLQLKNQGGGAIDPHAGHNH
ncbi:MAG: efflux RND transporter periplasmic adaptor subunit [Aeoliella sp.]